LSIGLVLLAACGTPRQASGARYKQHTVYAVVQQFLWDEADANGVTIVEEEGAQLGLGYKYDGAHARARAEITGGDVDYDGQTQDGTPLQTETGYLGLLLEGDWKFIRPRRGEGVFRRRPFEPYVGGGLRYWNRELGAAPGGFSYTEDWLTFYLHLGFEASKWFSENRRIYVNMRGGVTAYTIEQIDLSTAGLGTFTVNPEPGGMLRLEGGWEQEALHLTLFVETATWGQSDPDIQGGIAAVQPDSRMLRFGLNLGGRW
jgi:hypothetical protein